MTPTLRITAAMMARLRADLHRPHAFAAERIGFLHCRIGNRDGADLLLLPYEFQPVPDDEYVEDPHVGARINRAAIERELRCALRGDCSILHAHMHDWPGDPRFSDVDLEDAPRLAQALVRAAPALPHGMLLLSRDSARAMLWFSGRAEAVTPRFVFIGRPLTVAGG